ncbi:AbrB/MazE/SpoVT family DNA-binding domain-containing protein [Alicyclobacillus fodiniaquatilis]|uniref:AbrB/MazE/SpoVT family DNA-binding domain-containing protein n=1 Tax=Alicyclobacillus fodiniaquatilis TaxID=1661150 RepID=A0ABW4JLC4_9BACL
MSKITQKNQITIPTSIRKALGTNPGDRVVFRVNDEGEVILRAIKQVSPDALYGALHRPENEYMPMDKLRDQISEELTEKYRGAKEEME